MNDTVVELLSNRASDHPERVAFRHLVDGDVDGQVLTWTYGDIDRRARGVATQLAHAPGFVEDAAGRPRALLVFDQDLWFLAGFFGCLYAGAIAVPTSTPDPTRLTRTLTRLGHIARDSGARVGLTTSAILRLVRGLGAAAPELGRLHWIAVDSGEAAHAAPAAAISAESIAFLQYTSGSTGDPKGVIVTHRHLLANQEEMAVGIEHGTSNVVSWLPMFHDMGLIGAVLNPVYTGGTCTFMSPLAFLQRPLAWLRAIAGFRANISASPNFGYELATRRARPQDLDGLDLSSWHTALSGAEPVRAATLERFTAKFARCGLRADALFPAYGLAEATLFVSGARRGAPPRMAAFDPDALEGGRARPTAGDVRRLVSCGVAVPPTEIAIVRGSARLDDGLVGEIWIRGPSITRGYWQKPEETERVFGARLDGDPAPWLRTGDLGFIDRGELFVTGRMKDLLIVRGRNHYPSDLEHTAENSHVCVRQGCSVAFGVEVDGDERVVLAFEIDRKKSGAPVAEIARAAREAVLDGHGLKLEQVVLLEPHALPKTSSGKVQRQATRSAWLTGQLKETGDDGRA